MKIKFVRSVVVKQTHCQAGTVADLPDDEARHLIALRRAEHYAEPSKTPYVDTREPAVDTRDPRPKRKANKDPE